MNARHHQRAPIRHCPVRALLAMTAAVALLAALGAPVLATHGRPSQAVPIVGQVHDVAAYEQVPAGFPIARDTFDGRCLVPSNWVIGYAGTGHADHLGAIAAVGSHCTRIDFATLTGDFGDARWVLTAADGDTLVLTFAGTFAVLPADGVIAGTFDWTVVAGTGRFVHASGSGTATVTAPLTAPGEPTPETIDFWGTIAYDASDRAGG